jgi:hypothetical protein
MTDEHEACGYPDHRWADWHLQGSTHLECGVCHPPADGLPAIGIDDDLVEPELRSSRFVARGHLSSGASS